MTDRQRKEKAAELLEALLLSSPEKKTVNRFSTANKLPDNSSARSYAAAYSALGRAAADETAKASAALSGGYANDYAPAAAALSYGEYLKNAYKAYPDLNEVSLGRISSATDLRSRLAEAYDELERSSAERYADEQARYISALKSWAKISKYLG